MARLYTLGFETQQLSGTATMFPEASGVQTINTVSVETTTVRSGAGAIKCEQGASNYIQVANVISTLDRAYYLRIYFRTDALPGVGTQSHVIQVLANATAVASVRLNNNGTLALYDNGPSTVGSASSAISVNTWYMIELEIMIPTAGSGTLDARLNGTSFASDSTAAVGNSVTGGHLRFGNVNGATAGQFNFIDDVAINDDQGSAQNSWPGQGKIVYLKPVSDSAVGTGWEGPQTTGSDTTDLYDNVNNTPPQGVAHSDDDTNAGKYVFNAASTTTGDFDVNCQSYEGAGIDSTDTITLCFAHAITGSSSGTNTSGALDLVSNPDQGSETSITAFDLGVAGTAPTNWKAERGTINYSPSVTLATSPVVRVGKRQATTRVAMVSLMGVYVEYQPTQGATLGQITESDAANATGRIKTEAIGLTSETDTALALGTPKKSRAVGLITETQTAQAFGKTKVMALGLATETDTALPLQAAQFVDVGLVTETDAALSITPSKRRDVGLAEETDQAIAIQATVEGADEARNLALLHIGS